MGKQIVVPVIGGFVAGVAGMLLIACSVAPSPEPVVPTPSPTASVPYDAPGTIYEDDPQWDCRSMGNQICGVEIKGDWYLIGFNNGEPTGSVVKNNDYHR